MSAVHFSDVLDAKTGRAAIEPAARLGRTPPPCIWLHTLYDARPARHGRETTPPEATPSTAHVRATDAFDVDPLPEVRSGALEARALTPSQVRALGLLRARGAGWLGHAFTDTDLKHAYRLLAKAWHPDRHPFASPSERSGLALAFAEVHDAFTCLADVGSSPAD
ncbi:MAG: J domain-containing protein [Vicinamibacterales bacterium]